MPSVDLHSNIDSRIVLLNRFINISTTTAGEIIDTSGFESIEYVIQSGIITDGVFAILLEEGDDAGLSDAAAVSSDETLGSLTGFDNTLADTTIRIGSIGKKRFQRLSLVVSGASSGGAFTATAILGHPHTAPVEQ